MGLRSLVAAFALVLAVARAGPVQADAAAKAQAVDAAVQAWMSEYKIASAAVAVGQAGNIAGAYGHGGWSAQKPHLLASLSKAITAVCAAQLIDSGKIKLHDTLGQLLAPQIAATPPADPRFAGITLEQVLTHRAGLEKNTFGGAHDMDAALKVTLATKLKYDPGSTFWYSDSGYLLVGRIIEQATGKSYLNACLPVLKHVGANGGLDPTMPERAPNGGWDVSAADYAKFLSYLEKSSALLGAASHTWLWAPGGKPAYSLGAYVKSNANGPLLTHTGLAHHDATHPKKGGSYFVVDGSGLDVVVIFSGQNNNDAYNKLAAVVTKVLSTPDPEPAKPVASSGGMDVGAMVTASIGGKAWSGPVVTSVYTNIGGKPVFNMAARFTDGPVSFVNFNLYVPAGGNLKGTISLKSGNPLQSSHGVYNADVGSGDVINNSYSFVSGQVTVSSFDPATKTIAGTFSGTVRNHAPGGGKQLEIKDGKFSGVSYDPALVK